MLSSIDSPHQQHTFRKSAPYNACRVAAEIQSLVRDMPIIENDASDEVNFVCGRLKYSNAKREWSILHRSTRASGNSNYAGIVNIASLWPVSVIVPKKDINCTEGKGKISTKSSIDRSSLNLERQQNNRECKNLLNQEDQIGRSSKKDCFDSIVSNEIDCNMVKTVSSATLRARECHQTSPPTELVRRLLNGAELISIMNCVRQDVKNSAYKNNNNAIIDAENMQRNARSNCDEEIILSARASHRSRRKTGSQSQRRCNLKSMIVELAQAMIGENSKSSKPSPLSSSIVAEPKDNNMNLPSKHRNVLRFIDECIRYTQVHTLELVAPWSSSWEMRTNLRSLKVETSFNDENCSSPVRDSLSSAKSTFTSMLHRNDYERCERKCRNKNGNSISFSNATISKIRDFVKACLAHTLEEGNTLGSHEANINFDDSGKECINDSLSGLIGTKVSKRNKIVTCEPADSLAATSIKSTPSPKSKHTLSFTKKEKRLEKQGRKRTKYNRYTSPPSSSVLESTAKVSLEKSKLTQPTRNISWRKRKNSDLSSLEMKRNKRRTREKNNTTKKEHNKHDLNCPNIHEVVSDTDSMPPTSLLEFFETKRKQSESMTERGIVYLNGVNENKVRNKDVRVLSPQKHKGRDHDTFCGPQIMRRSDGSSRVPPRHCETRVSKKDVLRLGNNRFETTEQEHESTDSLHRLSKTSGSIRDTHRSSYTVSLRNKSSSESNKRRLSNSLESMNDAFIEGQDLENTSYKTKNEAKVDKAQNSIPLVEISPCFETSNDFSRMGCTRDQEKPTPDALSKDEIKSQIIRKNNEIFERIDISTNSGTYSDKFNSNDDSKDFINQSGNRIITVAGSFGLPWVRLSHIVSTYKCHYSSPLLHTLSCSFL